MANEVVGSFRISGDTYNKLVATANAKGLHISGNQGQADYDGITFAYSYDGATLSISVLKKPFFVSYSEISNHLNQIYHEAING